MEFELSVKESSIAEYYDANSLAVALKISRSMVYYLRDNDKIKCIKIGKAKSIFTKENVIEYLISEGYKIK
jgi:hypothetical protein